MHYRNSSAGYKTDYSLQNLIGFDYFNEIKEFNCFFGHLGEKRSSRIAIFEIDFSVLVALVYSFVLSVSHMTDIELLIFSARSNYR